MANKSSQDLISTAPLIAALDPRTEARANAAASRNVQEARRAILDEQIKLLSKELDAVIDTISALTQLEATLTKALEASHGVALEEL